MIPELLARFEHEHDEGLSLAYASALGKMGVVEALPMMLDRLAQSNDDAISAELALAVARLLGNERSYIQVARSMRSQPGTAIAQSIANIRRHLARARHGSEALTVALVQIEDDFAREQLDAAARALGGWMEQSPAVWYETTHEPVVHEVVREVACKLQQFGAARPEYVLLGLHAMTVGLVE
jgi:hypothetical protein